MVLRDVPDDCTVVGVPGRIVKRAGITCVGTELMHNGLPDPEEDEIAKLRAQVEALCARIDELEKGRGGSARRRAPAPRPGRLWPVRSFFLCERHRPED